MTSTTTSFPQGRLTLLPSRSPLSAGEAATFHITTYPASRRADLPYDSIMTSHGTFAPKPPTYWI
jgi:hypothetical protein